MIGRHIELLLHLISSSFVANLSPVKFLIFASCTSRCVSVAISSLVIRVPGALPSVSAIAERRFASGMLTVCAEVERGVKKKSKGAKHECENENVLCFR